MPKRQRGLTALLVVVVAALVSACTASVEPAGPPPTSAPSPSLPSTGSAASSTPITWPIQPTTSVPPAPPPTTRATTTATTPAAPPTPRTNPPATHVTPRGTAITTPEGFWWGVDSTQPISAATIANVRGWYLGATPQLWGRYLGGHFAATRAELAYARSQHIYVYLIVADKNCSACAGGDVCGNDTTAAQAQTDALAALSAAAALAVPRGATLWKDIEQVGACRGEPTGTYLVAWYQTLKNSGYGTGFYGNTHRQDFDFPRAYCAALPIDAGFARDVVMIANEDEPQIAAPRNTIGPHNAPKWGPKVPSCSRPEATKIWQYGESRSNDNATDVDLARPDTPGLLAPDGTVT